MRTSSWAVTLFLTAMLCATAAVAADAAPATEATLEKINGTPAATEHNMKDCPMQQGKKDCMHKNGEPCPVDKMDGSSAALSKMKDCPVNHKNEECQHKKGEPCPSERKAKFKSQSPEKCDYKKQG